MTKPHLFQSIALSLPLALVAVTGATAQNIPTNQQRSPATFDQYPYRPACRQLTAAPGRVPGWLAWGPTVEGEHQNWRGIKANVPPERAYEQLAAVGLCVQDGELVPFAALEGDRPKTIGQRNVEQLKAKASNPDEGDAFAQFIFIGGLAFGGLLLWEKLEEKPFVRCLARVSNSQAFTHVPPSYVEAGPASDIPDRVSESALADLPNSPTPPRSALERLAASPFISRAVFGAQRTGKTNLVAAVMQQLVANGVKVFVINLSSVNVGNEDAAYWDKEGIRSVRGDLETIDGPDAAQQLIDDAIALVDEFMRETSPSILIVDEWTNATASHAEYVDLLAPLIKLLAGKITAFSSTGMKRKKALWTIAPEIVAGTMEDFGKAVKKLSLCLVAISPGHTAQWDGQALSFSWELYGQVSKNYVGLTPPPEASAESRIAYLDGQWVGLGTESLVSVTATAPSDKAVPVAAELPAIAQQLSPELTTFREWLNSKVGQIISYQSFNNANRLKSIGRSRENYDLYCDKAVMKGWLVAKSDDSYFVLE